MFSLAPSPENRHFRLPFQNLFVLIQSDFLRGAGQDRVGAASGVAGDSHLSNANPAAAEIGEDRDQHEEVVVDLALREASCAASLCHRPPE